MVVTGPNHFINVQPHVIMSQLFPSDTELRYIYRVAYVQSHMATDLVDWISCLDGMICTCIGQDLFCQCVSDVHTQAMTLVMFKKRRGRSEMVCAA